MARRKKTNVGVEAEVEAGGVEGRGQATVGGREAGSAEGQGEARTAKETVGGREAGCVETRVDDGAGQKMGRAMYLRKKPSIVDEEIVVHAVAAERMVKRTTETRTRSRSRTRPRARVGEERADRRAKLYEGVVRETSGKVGGGVSGGHEDDVSAAVAAPAIVVEKVSEGAVGGGAAAETYSRMRTRSLPVSPARAGPLRKRTRLRDSEDSDVAGGVSGAMAKCEAEDGGRVEAPAQAHVSVDGSSVYEACISPPQHAGVAARRSYLLGDAQGAHSRPTRPVFLPNEYCYDRYGRPYRGPNGYADVPPPQYHSQRLPELGLGEAPNGIRLGQAQTPTQTQTEGQQHHFGHGEVPPVQQQNAFQRNAQHRFPGGLAPKGFPAGSGLANSQSLVAPGPAPHAPHALVVGAPENETAPTRSGFALPLNEIAPPTNGVRTSAHGTPENGVVTPASAMVPSQVFFPEGQAQSVQGLPTVATATNMHNPVGPVGELPASVALGKSTSGPEGGAALSVPALGVLHTEPPPRTRAGRPRLAPGTQKRPSNALSWQTFECPFPDCKRLFTRKANRSSLDSQF